MHKHYLFGKMNGYLTVRKKIINLTLKLNTF